MTPDIPPFMARRTDWRQDTGTIRAARAEAAAVARRPVARWGLGLLGLAVLIGAWLWRWARRPVVLPLGIVVALGCVTALQARILMTPTETRAYTMTGPTAEARARALADAAATYAPSVVAAASVPTSVALVVAGGGPECDFPTGMPDAVAQGETNIRQAAADNGMDCRALALLWSIEAPGCYGNGVGNCVSPSGALGPGQVMPGTAYEIEAATGWPCTSQAHDTLTSLRCGAWYYVQRMRQASSVWRPDDEAPNLGVAGACYNAGGASQACSVALAAAQAGRDPCEAIAGYARGEPASWCRQMVSGWRRVVVQ